MRKLLGTNKIGGVEKVFVNLCKSFDKLGAAYTVNRAFKKIAPDEPVVILGLGQNCLDRYNRPNKIIAGIGLMTHPSEWPSLFSEYPVAKYLQHSNWSCNVYIPYYGKDNCETWPAGIDTDHWAPDHKIAKTNDVLIYNKIRWDKQNTSERLLKPIKEKLDQLGLSYKEIIYGYYDEKQYFDLLQQSKSMIFLCEHESQGFACCEALSMDVPVFAWDQGYCLDPNRFDWNDPVIPATSVPFFDQRCGMRFKDLDEFDQDIAVFWSGVKQGKFTPRNFVVENLSLEKSGLRMLEIINRVYH
ncbi:MAG TPA: hypothetical protein VNW51_03695 [Mucilaginibacter sp.]|jgi:glycosyltransferase involved in cell wall biosynthesis|nr:hypothetical protein [Mucilaginibacter sp.]